MSGDFIDVWPYSLRPEPGGRLAAASLSAHERARAASLARPADRVRYIAARAGLRAIIADYVGSTPEALQIAGRAHEKPYLDGSAWAFNLSHCGDRALLAVAHGANVGIDLERERDDIDVAPVVAHYFSPAERDEFDCLPVEGRRPWFFRQWVAKEAVVKAHGGGLSIAPSLFAVRFADAPHPRVVSPGPDPGAHWQLRMLDAGAGWHAAVAFDGPPRVVRFRTRDAPHR